MRIGKSIVACFGAGVLFFAGFWIRSAIPLQETGTAQLNRNVVENLDGAGPAVQDAIQRWSQKAAISQENVQRNWLPRAMFIPTRNQGQGMLCIQLQIKQGNFGGSPVYCYDDDTSKPSETLMLVAEYSNVE